MSNWNDTISFKARAVSQKWNIFTSVVCSCVGWVISMVRSNQRDRSLMAAIISGKRSSNSCKAITVTMSIATVAVKSIKVHQVCEMRILFKLSKSHGLQSSVSIPWLFDLLWPISWLIPAPLKISLILPTA